MNFRFLIFMVLLFYGCEAADFPMNITVTGLSIPEMKAVIKKVYAESGSLKIDISTDGSGKTVSIKPQAGLDFLSGLSGCELDSVTVMEPSGPFSVITVIKGGKPLAIIGSRLPKGYHILPDAVLDLGEESGQTNHEGRVWAGARLKLSGGKEIELEAGKPQALASEGITWKVLLLGASKPALNRAQTGGGRAATIGGRGGLEDALFQADIVVYR